MYVCQYLSNQVTVCTFTSSFRWCSLWRHCSRLYGNNRYNSI